MDIHALELIRESRTESHCSIAGRGAHDQCRNLLYLHLHVGGELRRHGRESNRRHPRGSNWPSWCPVSGSYSKLVAICGCRRLLRDWSNCGGLFAMATAAGRSFRWNDGGGGTVRSTFENRGHRFVCCCAVRCWVGCAQNLRATEC